MPVSRLPAPQRVSPRDRVLQCMAHASRAWPQRQPSLRGGAHALRGHGHPARLSQAGCAPRNVGMRSKPGTRLVLTQAAPPGTYARANSLAEVTAVGPKRAQHTTERLWQASGLTLEWWRARCSAEVAQPGGSACAHHTHGCWWNYHRKACDCGWTAAGGLSGGPSCEAQAPPPQTSP